MTHPRLLALSLLISITTANLLAQAPDTVWTKTIGGTGEEMLTSIEPTSDGGYVVGGYSTSFTGSEVNWLLLLDAAGDTVWTKYYATTTASIQKAIPVSTGGFVFVTDGDPLMIKTDANGVEIWRVTNADLGGLSEDRLFAVYETAAGDFLACGRYSGAGSVIQPRAAKVLSTGAVAWSQTYSVPNYSRLGDILEKADGTIIAAGMHQNTSTDAWLLNLAANGDSTSSVFYGDLNPGETDYFNVIRATTDGGYIFAGQQELSGNGRKMFIVKTTADGTWQWENTFVGDEANDVIETADGGFTMICMQDEAGLSMQMVVAHVSAIGDSLWRKSIGGISGDAGFGIAEMSAGEYLAVGTSDIVDPALDGWIVRLGASGPVGPTAFESDSLALVDIYNSTGGATWTDKTNWLTGTVDTWQGVTITGGRVTELYLHNNNLSGTIPASIGDLSELTRLKLGVNQFTGPIPGEIGNLAKLTILGLQSCGLSELPTELGNLSALDILYLYDNNLTGVFPNWITNIAGLSALQLQNNQLTGPLPAGITNLTHLNYFYIENNQFDFGDIEDFLATGSPLNDFIYSPQAKIGSDTSITVFETEQVLLTVATGGVDNLYQWKKDDLPITSAYDDTLLIESAILEDTGVYTLEVTHPTATDLTLTSWPIQVNVLFGTFESDSLALLDLYNNCGGTNWSKQSGWLTSPLVGWEGVTVTGDRVTSLNLYQTGITGDIPASIGNLTALTSLRLWINEITSVPTEIGKLVNLIELALSKNQIATLPESIGNLTQLEKLYLSENLLANLPGGIGNLENLQELAVSKNQLTSIPAAIGGMDSLRHLSLDKNQIGALPPEIGNLAFLEYLGLNDNLLTGLPTEIGNLVNLTDMWLSNNMLPSLPDGVTGLSKLARLYLDRNQLSSLPTALSGMTGLTTLHMNNNSFTAIPAGIFDLPNLEGLHLGYNQLNTSIPVEFGLITNLNYLDLGNNMITGAIPLELGKLKKLKWLWLFNNQLTGNIPDTLGTLPKLQQLMLSNNMLTGTIPEALGQDTSLISLGLGGNKLTGAVPASLTNLHHLSSLNIAGNDLTDLPDFSTLAQQVTLNIYGNRFNFGDIEPNMGLGSISYAPQDSIGAETTFTIAAGSNLVLDVPMGGTATTYQWKRNGVDIAGATGATYTITGAVHDDGGTYNLRANNTIVTGLELISRNQFVIGPNSVPVAGADSAITIPSGYGFSLDVVSISSDPDGDELHIKELRSTRYGDTDKRVYTGSSLMLYQSMPGYTGPDTVWYTVDDGMFGTATGRIILTISEQPIGPYITASETVGGAEDDYVCSMAGADDGGYVIAGYTESTGSGGKDGWLIKVSAAGVMVWEKTFGGAGEDIFHSISATAAGGFIIAGETESVGDADAWLVKVDNSGNTAWEKTYGGDNFENAVSVLATSDGGYLFGGQTDTYGAGGSDAWLVKTNATGDTIWTKAFGGTEFDQFTAVQLTNDGEYIAVGHTESTGAGGKDVWLLKIDATGQITWEKNFGGNGHEIGNSVQQTADGGYILVGSTEPWQTWDSDVWIIKTDASGQTAWTKSIENNGNDAAHSVYETPTGGFAITGFSNTGWQDTEVWLVGMDNQGNITRERQMLGGFGSNMGMGVLMDDAGEVVVAANTNSFGLGGYDLWFIKVNLGTINSTDDIPIAVPATFALRQNYPNPFNPSTTIQFDMPIAGDVKLIVYDILGREVVELAAGLRPAGYHQIRWSGRAANGRNMPTGMYFARLVAPEYTKVIKMLLLK